MAIIRERGQFVGAIPSATLVYAAVELWTDGLTYLARATSPREKEKHDDEAR